ncbi:MAG: PD-(D/E)XK nuclease family protein [Elusimicrobia bacterium]|nr:PD-(D/E)XK nuclease family protein [Elusimicrobiota bacterium]
MRTFSAILSACLLLDGVRPALAQLAPVESAVAAPRGIGSPVALPSFALNAGAQPTGGLSLSLQGGLEVSRILAPSAGLSATAPSGLLAAGNQFGAGRGLSAVASATPLLYSPAVGASVNLAAPSKTGFGTGLGGTTDSRADAGPLSGAYNQLSASGAGPANRGSAVIPGDASDVVSGMRRFDGIGERAYMSDQADVRPGVSPLFEAPVTDFAPEFEPPDVDEVKAAGKHKNGLEPLTFGPADGEKLVAVDPAKSIYKFARVVRDVTMKNPDTGKSFNPSRAWWDAYAPGKSIEVHVSGENVFGRQVKVKSNVVKPIGKLTEDDLKGLFAPYQLKVVTGHQLDKKELSKLTIAELKTVAAKLELKGVSGIGKKKLIAKIITGGIETLKVSLIKKLEDRRQRFRPLDETVDMDTKVAVIEFQSYLDLYREVHGKNAMPEPPSAKERTPLKIKAEGRLEALSYVLPRVVFLDVDMFDGPLPSELLTDISKLQRLNVHFVAFSRKGYAAPGGIKEKLISPMSFYHRIMLPSRLLAVTDNGAVINAFGKDAVNEPVDVAFFTENEMAMLRDAAHKASERTGIPPSSVKEVPQPPLVQPKKSFFSALMPLFSQRPANIRLELEFPESIDKETRNKWLIAFHSNLHAYQLASKVKMANSESGSVNIVAQKTVMRDSMDRVFAALGDRGLYVNPTDPIILSNDNALALAVPQATDMGKITGLRGTELVENVLGLALGEHRIDEPGDLKGSASRISGYMHYKERFRQELLVREDDKGSIFTFAGHVIHVTNDWLMWQRNNGKKPSWADYREMFDKRWERGLRLADAVTMPPADKIENSKRAFLIKARVMFRILNMIADRGEIILATEVPNFFYVRDYARRTQERRRRYLLRTVFDFVALRPNPDKPGHADIVIYDFKTGRTESRETNRQRKFRKSQHLQMLIYSFFAKQKWVGRRMPVPYFSGTQSYIIDDVKAELIFNSVKIPIEITPTDMDAIPALLIRQMNAIHRDEQMLTSVQPLKKKKK